ncbi:MAG: DUF1343 domain-containing protein [Marinilabiliaceae bacterium]|jgi:uncharacterized protein YbbC (DUF1343 family)|nr:DUF1343 domain-containing protein [Marinilabiliaceae bacterium]
MKRILLPALFLLFSFLYGCSQPGSTGEIKTGASRTDLYFPLLTDMKVGVVANHTSLIEGTHLVDSLVSSGIDVERIFSPEHGFRGTADAGAHIEDGVDATTGISVLSLYGANRKPGADQLDGLDVMLFDIQDVGTRFYTYISTLQYVMEVCADMGIPLIVLDRPNPNGHLVDGPVLDTAFRSFVGMQPVPVAHGMTVGEYALMLNGEAWLEGGAECKLRVIECLNWDHNREYRLEVAPSPNLPNQNSVWLYPSICFFEGTVFSCGRGTDYPFQLFGHPDYPDKDFSFTPRPGAGAASPKLNGEACFGVDLTEAEELGIVPLDRLELEWLINAYTLFPDKDSFFIPYFNTLAGTDKLKQQIIDGLSEDEIRQSWEKDLEAFKATRSKYLIYE